MRLAFDIERAAPGTSSRGLFVLLDRNAAQILKAAPGTNKPPLTGRLFYARFARRLWRPYVARFAFPLVYIYLHVTRRYGVLWALCGHMQRVILSGPPGSVGAGAGDALIRLAAWRSQNRVFHGLFRNFSGLFYSVRFEGI